MIISAAKATEAAGVLGVGLEDLTPEILKKAYRVKAKECHPDYHGNEKLTLWSRVSWANECLNHWLNQKPKEQSTDVANTGDCRACGGEGRVRVGKTRGFGKPLTVICVMCNGTGALSKERDQTPGAGEG